MEEKVNDKDILTALKQASEGFGSGYIGDLYKDTLDLINRQKAEIERLTEYNANLNGMCLEFIDKNAELQKQVDELTDKLGKVLSGIKADELLIAKGIEQAVKDTAKEILEDFDKHGVYSKDYTDFMRKEYSVEVE